MGNVFKTAPQYGTKEFQEYLQQKQSPQYLIAKYGLPDKTYRNCDGFFVIYEAENAWLKIWHSRFYHRYCWLKHKIVVYTLLLDKDIHDERIWKVFEKSEK